MQKNTCELFNSHYDNNNISTAGRATALLSWVFVFSEDFSSFQKYVAIDVYSKKVILSVDFGLHR
jgi:hypothetical protein